MEFLNSKATEIFAALLEGMQDRQHRKIQNEHFMPLTMERIGINIQTPWGEADLYSLCHYYIQNGDLMQDPEMCFFVVDQRETNKADYDKIKVAPYMFTQANLGIYQESALIEDNSITKFRRAQQADHTDFANGWLINIQSQGFLKPQNNEK